VRVFLEYRQAERRAGAYGVEFVERWLHPSDGRLHPRYHLMGASTGRMSASKPATQNIPNDPFYRRCFAPQPGYALVKADFGQLELRIAAEIAGDEALIGAFNRGDDVHALTASLVLDVPPDRVSKNERQQAKALNFGLQYGMGVPRLRTHALQNYGVVFSAEQAELLRTRFFDTYRGLRRWHRSQPEGLCDTRTLAGRRR